MCFLKTKYSLLFLYKEYSGLGMVHLGEWLAFRLECLEGLISGPAGLDQSHGNTLNPE